MLNIRENVSCCPKANKYISIFGLWGSSTVKPGLDTLNRSQPSKHQVKALLASAHMDYVIRPSGVVREDLLASHHTRWSQLWILIRVFFPTKKRFPKKFSGGLWSRPVTFRGSCHTVPSVIRWWGAAGDWTWNFAHTLIPELSPWPPSI